MRNRFGAGGRGLLGLLAGIPPSKIKQKKMQDNIFTVGCGALGVSSAALPGGLFHVT